MRKTLKSNQRRKLLNRQHHKMSARRLSHFNHLTVIQLEQQNSSATNLQ